jgi:hypothetical protein
LSIGLYLLVAPGLAQDGEETPAGARQNLVLRQFFMEEYLSTHSRLVQSFMESYVDRRIDGFLENSRKHQQELTDAFEESRRLYFELSSLRQPPNAAALGQSYRESFRQLGEKAGQLRKHLSTVLPASLRYKSDFNPTFSSDPSNNWLGRELEEIGNRVGLVGRHLDNLLFDGEPVVAVDDLGDRDLLVLLFEIRKICRLSETALTAQKYR